MNLMSFLSIQMYFFDAFDLAVSIFFLWCIVISHLACPRLQSMQDTSLALSSLAVSFRLFPSSHESFIKRSTIDLPNLAYPTFYIFFLIRQNGARKPDPEAFLERKKKRIPSPNQHSTKPYKAVSQPVRGKKNPPP